MEISMPKELTAENGAKALLSGEFFEKIETDCVRCDGSGRNEWGNCIVCSGYGYHTKEVPISWISIKDIYKMAVKHFTENPHLINK